MRGEIIFNLVVMSLSLILIIYYQYCYYYKQQPLNSMWVVALTVLFPNSCIWLLEDMYEFTEWWTSLVIVLPVFVAVLGLNKWIFTWMRKRRA